MLLCGQTYAETLPLTFAMLARPLDQEYGNWRAVSRYPDHQIGFRIKVRAQ
jgi:hypothetical protein